MNADTPTPKPVYYYETDQFTRGYITCALWSSVDDDGNPLYSDKDASDLAPITLQRMIADCVHFQNANAVSLAVYDERMGTHSEFGQMERAGQDFWLTRNGHGTGFWDRKELSKFLQDVLTRASKAFGSCDLYIGDDGLIYC